MNAPPSQQQLMHEINAIKNYLTAAQDIVKSGHMPDISGLENRVAAVCDAIQKAEHDIQKNCLPELTALLEHLNACDQAMRASQEKSKQACAES